VIFKKPANTVVKFVLQVTEIAKYINGKYNPAIWRWCMKKVFYIKMLLLVTISAFSVFFISSPNRNEGERKLLYLIRTGKYLQAERMIKRFVKYDLSLQDVDRRDGYDALMFAAMFRKLKLIKAALSTNNLGESKAWCKEIIKEIQTVLYPKAEMINNKYKYIFNR
jgi:hypothetical protein